MATRDAVPAQLYRFGPFELDVRSGELRKYGTRIRLQEQPLRILTMLLARPGEAVLREEIQCALWPNRTVVEFDQGINAAIKRLRTALGDSAVGARYIETLARRGYRFIGALEPVQAASPEKEVPPGTDDLEGRTIGHYRVLEKLGSGGMGVVYRAEDLRLGRKVALKLLHEPACEVAPGALARFRREARAAAALSHPNVCVIFGVEDLAGEPAIVMELLDGETMAARLARGPLPFDQVRRLGCQLASALDAGHRAGIVHRDFKPANIILTANGAKILDFGLAKADGDGVIPGIASISKAGAILGTLNYLSPEQAQGKEVDPASDVFAFGAVLYEMATGEQAFAGDNPASVFAAILERQPRPISSLRPEIPPALERIVLACLQKDPQGRPSLSDVAHELEIVPDRGALPPPEVLPVRRPRRRLLLALAAVAVLLLAGRYLGQILNFPVTVNQTLITQPDGATWIGAMAISPNGRQLATVILNRNQNRRLWVRSLTSSEEKILPGTEGASFPFWAPDSKQIGFFARGKLQSVSLSSGSVRSLVTAPASGGGAWSSGGKILSASQLSGFLSLIAADGGAARPLAGPGEGELVGLSQPQFLPDGRRFIFSGWDRDSATPAVFLGSLDSPAPRLLLKDAAAPQFAPPDFLLFLQGGRIMAQEFDWILARPVSEPFAVTGNPNARNGNTAGQRVAAFSVSQNGILAWRTAPPIARERLAWHSRDGRFLHRAGEPGRYMEVFLSPDGASAAVNLGAAAGNLGVLNLASDTMTQVTAERPTVYDGVWSPDSRQIAFQIYTPPKTRILTVTLGQPAARSVLDDGSLSFPDAWSPDGKSILVRKQTGGRLSVGLLPADGTSKVHEILKTKFLFDQIQFSPDGRRVAYNSTESGRWEVYVADFPGMQGVIRISDGGGCQPIWRRDGKELFYLTLDGKLMSVDMGADTGRPGKPARLFASRIHVFAGFAQYAADAAGTQFLMIEPDSGTEPRDSAEPIHIMTNWAAKSRD